MDRVGSSTSAPADSGIKIALLSGEPFVDRIGNDMGYPAPIVRRGEILLTDQLLAGEHVPQAELGFEPAVGVAGQSSRDQRLRVDHTPIGETRYRVGVDDSFDIGGGIDGANRPERRRSA
jgi:hypothetical protein